MERRVLTTTFIITLLFREAVSIRCYTDLKKTKVSNNIIQLCKICWLFSPTINPNSETLESTEAEKAIPKISFA